MIIPCRWQGSVILDKNRIPIATFLSQPTAAGHALKELRTLFVKMFKVALLLASYGRMAVAALYCMMCTSSPTCCEAKDSGAHLDMNTQGAVQVM